MNSFRNRSLVIVGAMIASVAGIAATAPAQAQTAQVSVHYDDLNLRSAQGQKTLAHRINSAAGQVCRVSEDQNSVEYRRCHSQATENAQQALSRAGVTSSL